MAPEVETLVARALEAGRRQISLGDLEDAFASGQQFRAIDVCLAAADRTREILEDELPELLLATLVAAADGVVTIARRNGGYIVREDPVEQDIPIGTLEAGDELRTAQPLVHAFDQTNPAAINWAQDHSAELIKQIDSDTRGAIRDIMSDAFQLRFDEDDKIRGVPPRVSARRIRPLIGLTRPANPSRPGPWSWTSVENLRARLEKQGLSAAEIQRQTDRYAATLRTRRARGIARTETISAANEGQQQLWAQAVERGELSGNERQEWIVTPDAALADCPICRPMAGQLRPLGQYFRTGTGRQVLRPPAHPHCRCALGLVSSVAEDAGPAFAPIPPSARPSTPPGARVNFGRATQQLLDDVARTNRKMDADEIWRSLDRSEQRKISDFIERGRRNSPEYQQLLEDVADEFGYAVGDFQNPVGRTYINGPLKADVRAAEKIVMDYGGDVEKLSDVLRSTFVVDDPAEAERVLKAFQKIGNVVDDSIKNRMLEPLPGGYRDMIFKVQLDDGMLAEVQVNVPRMLRAKNGRGHQIYDEIRVLKKGTPEYNALMRESEELYGRSWSETCSRYPDFAGCKDIPFGSNRVNINQRVLDAIDDAERTGRQLDPSELYDLLDPEEAAKVDAFIARGAANEAEYKALLDDVAETFGFRPGDFNNPNAQDLILGPLKAPGRAAEKIIMDYGGNVERLGDVLRSTFVVDNPEDAVKIYERFRAISPDIGPLKNRFGSPLTGGYRDVNFKLELADGMFAEVQVNVPSMMRAKNGRGHEIYEELRKLQAGTPEYNALIEESEALYGRAWADVCRRHPTVFDCPDFLDPAAARVADDVFAAFRRANDELDFGAVTQRDLWPDEDNIDNDLWRRVQKALGGELPDAELPELQRMLRVTGFGMKGWVGGTSTPGAQKLNQAANLVFGRKLKYISDSTLFDGSIEDGVRALADAWATHYAATQELLRKAYPSGKITLYRAVRGRQAQAIKAAANVGDEIVLETNALSSWTVDRNIADTLPFRGDDGVVLVSEIDIEDVFTLPFFQGLATPLRGTTAREISRDMAISMHNEKEAIIYGAEHVVKVLKVYE